MVFNVFTRRRKIVDRLSEAAKPVLEALEGRLMLSTHRHTTSTVPAELLTGGTIREGGSADAGATLTEIKATYGLNQLSTYSNQYPLFDDTGNGQTIVVIGAAAPYVNDVPNGRSGNINIFSTNEDIPGLIDPVYIDQVGDVDQTGGSDPLGAVMSTMELEYAHSLAPYAQMIFVEVPSVDGVISPANLDLGIQEAVKDTQLDGLVAQPGPINEFLPGGVIDIGITSSGEDPTLDSEFDSLFSYKYAKDDTFIAPSGDTGGVLSTPSTSPYVTSVGGTVFETQTTVDGKNPQIASPYTGGGSSEYEPLPSFQDGITVNGKAIRTRSGPDLSMVSTVNGEGVYAYYDPTLADDAAVQTYTVEGTSVAAALFTGAMADMNELRESVGLGVIGRDLNNELYALYKQNSSLYFTDITQGNNTVFDAYRGFDLATGMGTPNFNALIPGLAGIQAPVTLTVKATGDQYASLSTVATGNAITPFAGGGSVTIFNNYIELALNLTNTQTIETGTGGTAITYDNTAVITFPTLEITRNTDGTFATDALGTVTTDGTISTYDLLFTGRVTGTGSNLGFSGTFYTVNRYGHRVSLGSYSIFQGQFTSV